MKPVKQPVMLIEKTKGDPVNKTAALVTSTVNSGFCRKKPLLHGHWELCPELKCYDGTGVNLKQRKFGQFVVVGIYGIRKGACGNQGSKRRWVCRCRCGHYELRKTKAITNPKNNKDCCDECKKTESLKRYAEYKMYGYNLDPNPER